MALEVGSRLGHYDVTALIGEGGMGQVYRATDTRLKRDVALKVLPANMAADSERFDRFQREAQAIASLNHPNVVTIHSVEQAGETHFLTMELVQGETLVEIIPPGGLPLEELLALALPLSDAVSAAHDRHIVHRDLKPANVMVGADGRLKVLDFGLAKLRSELSAASEVSTASTMFTSRTVCSGRRPTCRPSKPRANRPTFDPTSSRSASSCSRWRPARGRFAAILPRRLFHQFFGIRRLR